MKLQEYLSSIHSLTNEEFELLTENFQLKVFKRGEHVVTPGQIEKDIFFVNAGVLSYSFYSENKNNIMGFAYPPSICAIPESFFFQRPSKYYLTCLTDCQLNYLTFNNYQELLDNSQQIERLFRKLAETVGVGLINRQIELRTTTIEERYVAFCKRSPHLLQLIPHKYIASYLDINSTNFSKLFNSIKF